MLNASDNDVEESGEQYGLVDSLNKFDEILKEKRLKVNRIDRNILLLNCLMIAIAAAVISLAFFNFDIAFTNDFISVYELGLILMEIITSGILLNSLFKIRAAIRKIAHGLLRSSQVINHAIFFLTYVILSIIAYTLLGGIAGVKIKTDPYLAYKLLTIDYAIQCVSDIIRTFNICFLLRLVLLQTSP